VPRFGICELTTLRASFDEDLAAYRAAGATGIGVCELKVEGDADAPRRLRESGLAATFCVPSIPSILPLQPMPGPNEPEERVGAICDSVASLGRFEPDCVLFLTGPGPERRAEVLEGIGRIAEAGERYGVRVALEPVHSSQHDVFSFVNTIPDALDLLDEAGTPSVGLIFDTWHLWDTDGVEEQIRARIGRIAGVHVCDVRDPTRNDFDRLLPGDGVAPLGELLRALDEAGYAGSYDVEIFSDDGTFGDPLPDSIWAQPAADVALACRRAFEFVWSDR
jgi:sugar phosphate isomerase/epimerase